MAAAPRPALSCVKNMNPLTRLKEGAAWRWKSWQEARATRAPCADWQRDPDHCIAVFLPKAGHLRFMGGALKLCQDRGLRIHYYVKQDRIGAYQERLQSPNVYAYPLCVEIPYRLMLTAATHVRTSLYKHPKTRLAHIPHSMVSLHTTYGAGSFLGFDAIFCVGPYHLEEAHAIIDHNHQSGEAIPAGSEWIDYLAQEPALDRPADRPCVLVAPTWGEISLLARYGRDLVDRLIERYDVILRPHGLKFDIIEPVVHEICESYANHPGFQYELGVDSNSSLLKADLMVSDYSGIAFEFALARRRPVVFLDGPRKASQIDWRSVMEQDGIEVRGRPWIGDVVPNVDEMMSSIEGMLKDPEIYKSRIDEATPKLWYHSGEAATVLAEHIQRLLRESN